MKTRARKAQEYSKRRKQIRLETSKTKNNFKFIQNFESLKDQSRV